MTVDPVKLAVDLALGAVRLAEGIAEAAQRREAATLAEVRVRLETISAAIAAVAPAFAEREAARRAELAAEASMRSMDSIAESVAAAYPPILVTAVHEGTPAATMTSAEYLADPAAAMRIARERGPVLVRFERGAYAYLVGQREPVE